MPSKLELFAHRLRQPQHAIGQRLELPRRQPHRHDPVSVISEAQEDLIARSVAADGDDAAYVDQETLGLTGCLCHRPSRLPHVLIVRITVDEA